MMFLSSVTILCSAVKSQEHRNMDYYCNKAMLAERVEMLILEEPVDMMISSLRQQAMFCIMEMSHVNPKFQPLQRMELIQSGIFSLFSLPPNMETDTNREIISLYSQTVRALDEMLQGLMTETENPSMLVLIEIVEIIMPWILSDKIFEKVRALRTLSRQLRFISSFPVLRVPELIKTIHSNLSHIKDPNAIEVIEKTLRKLVQKYPDEAMLMLITIQDDLQDRELWRILAASSGGYAMILNHLLKRLKSLSFQDPKEPMQSLEINSVLASRALNELLLQSSSKLEVETLYPWLYMALLSLISFLVFEAGSQTIDKQPGVPEWMNPVSCTIESLKTLICSAGYEYQVSFMENHRTWELLAEPEGYLEGIFMIAKSMTMRSCWHIRPIVSLILNILTGNEVGSFITALAVFAELLQDTEVAIMADEAIVQLLINCVQKDEPVTQQLVLKATGNFGIHKETTKFLRMLQPYVLNCCYSMDSRVVTEAFLALRCIIYNLCWTDSVLLLIEISCTLRPFFDDESEELRYNSIDMFGALLAKVKRRFLMVPFRYQVHCSLVPLMFHLQDENVSVAHASRDGLCHSAKILVCPRFKAVCTDKDMFSIGRILLKEQKDKIPWFLSQSLSYFRSNQASIRQAAVWLTSQIIQTMTLENEEELQEVSSALMRLKSDPDPAVACLATQTIYLLEVKRIQQRPYWFIGSLFRRRFRGKKVNY
ncbi:maestro heat-like repeat-containing protein family member 7 [Trichosurus vulpecula]|uniref:maestro heat-like repeat-containing protein family member 7 n=1 Tax=Trichosurus vulpecula TaxID=9337 RepID=UPI00186B3587|nr:maestro heat-like repeat-containing protein family member 7 [Trichosurus vulpecula]